MGWPEGSFGKIALQIGLVIAALFLILRLIRGKAPPPDDRP